MGDNHWEIRALTSTSIKEDVNESPSSRSATKSSYVMVGSPMSESSLARFTAADLSLDYQRPMHSVG